MPKPHPAGTHTNTVTVRVPMVFRRRGGCKVLFTQGDAPRFRAARTHIDSALVKAIARAFRWQRLIETGVHATAREIADAEKVNASYVGRVLRLTLLAPNMIEAILYGRQPPEVTLNDLVKPFPAEWGRQQVGALRHQN